MTRTLKMRLMCLGLAVSLTMIGLALPMPTRAETVVNISVPYNNLVGVPCANGGAGELVALSGDLHVLINMNVSNSGNVHAKVHFQPQGVSGVGVTTGDKYQGTGVTQDEFNIAVGVEETAVNNFRIIGKGPGNNSVFHSLFHITVNANGDVTAFVTNISVDCK